MIKNVVLSNLSNTPIYKQLYDQILSQIFNGDLTANMALPSIRVAAKELRISVITVKKAWENLERNGYIYTLPGKGSYIMDLNKHSLENKKNDLLQDELLNQLEYYKELGVKKQQLIELLNKVYEEWKN